MKKIIIALAVLTFADQNNFAQTRFGLAAGANFTNNNEQGESKIKGGWQAGCYLSHCLSRKTLLQSILLYSEKNYFTYSQIAQKTLNLQSINLPVLFGYNVSSKFSFLAGPELSYLTNAQLKWGENDKLDVSSDFKAFYESIALQASFSAGNQWGVNLSYHNGIKNIKKESTGLKFFDRNMQLGLFYILK